MQDEAENRERGAEGPPHGASGRLPEKPARFLCMCFFLSLKCPKWRQYFRKKGRMRRVGVLHGGMPLSLRGLGLPGPRGYETRLSPRAPLARTSPASSWAGGGSEPGRPALRCSRRHLTRNAARSHTPAGQGQVPSVPWVKTTQSFAAQSSPRTHRLRLQRLCCEGHRESKAP